ncbi:45003_t:CDS:2, partial [Gigaspora margarita]
MNLDNQKSKLITEHLVTDLRLKTNVISISRNEASRSLFVSSYLVAATNLFSGKFEIQPKKYRWPKWAWIGRLWFGYDPNFKIGWYNRADAENWYFLECTLNDSEDLDFKLSKPVIVMYEDRNMENMISIVLGHIT